MDSLRIAAAYLTLFVGVVSAAFAQQSGRIQGVVKGDDGAGYPQAHIELILAGAVVQNAVSDDAGRFHFDDVPAGVYALRFSAPQQTETGLETDIDVRAGQTFRVDKPMLWHTGALVSLTVTAPSRQPEPIENAPAAISVVEAPYISLYGISGQVPNTLAAVPGAELMQNGLFDYNFNVRGFNTALNRRIQTSIDGRSPEIPLLGYQEWSSISLLTDDLDTIELVSGPSSAVYGANAFNGVVDIRTKSARESLGGTVRLTAGELDTVRIEARTAYRLGRGWYLKIAGGYHGSNDFSVSRNVTVEYPGLALEAIPIPKTHVDLGLGTATIEKYFSPRVYMLLEAGGASLSGVVFVTPTGRVESDNVRSWTRVKAVIPDWTFSFSSNTRNAPTTPALGSGAPITEFDDSMQASALTNRQFGSRAAITAGASWGRDYVNTAGPGGVQTLLAAPESDNHGDVFGEFRYSLTKSLTFIAAGDIAASTLHPVQFSPRLAAVYKLGESNSFRLSYNHAFQVANFVELFIAIEAGLPINLSAVETQLQPLTGGVPLGLSSVPILALGNPKLDVEKITSYEGGYRRQLGARNWFTVDYYRNEMDHFITDVLPGVNPAYPPYQAPSAIPQPERSIVSGIINSISPGFTNEANGDPAIVLSIGNSGRVNSQGVEFGVNQTFLTNWQAGANYSWFDFNAGVQPPGVLIHPNAPAHKAGANIGYHRRRFDADLRYRWVDAFPFANGVYVGPVPTYNVVDLGVRFQFNEHWQIGSSVSNLLNDEHYELFGGDILKRYALGTVAYSWK